MMSAAEERRKELLNQVRKQQLMVESVPAVHPRYRAAYRSIYDTKEEECSSGFAVRVLIAIILFAFYIALDQSDEKIAYVDTKQIVQEIQDNSYFKDITCNLK